MYVIAVSGTPGTGKSTFSVRLAKYLKFKYLGVRSFILARKLFSGRDRRRKTLIVDEKKLNKVILEHIDKLHSSPCGIVIDSHMSHFLPHKKVNLCIITKCSLTILKKRLEKRKYSKMKIRENLDCEIFEICLNEAKENGHFLLIVDTSKSVKETCNLYFKKISSLVRNKFGTEPR